MTKVLLVKKVYLDAFRNLGHMIIKHSAKAYFWFVAVLLSVVLYAFWYRIFTGFVWD
ncbi:DUF6747 family protein [Arenibacter sp. GZD96]|uniref:DUF6747 family protein n=1 Tax=Aurantibrevibacter litoralis TaxID=3106030 RepID=UPI002AFE44DD|nr:DUF6747 family protein [Arenibacter sp. GZD-96]MEA1785172.1 DUF6747 family protein [Arenibacter sp. GZD-96]